MMRGTQVVLNINPVVATAMGHDLELGDVGKVSSRKNNGWLRVTVQRTGKTISVRNINGQVTRILVASRPQVVRSALPLLVAAIACKNEQEHLAHISELEQRVDQMEEWLARALCIIKEYQTRYPSHEHPI